MVTGNSLRMPAFNPRSSGLRQWTKHGRSEFIFVV
jgi:hypothetical protein